MRTVFLVMKDHLYGGEMLKKLAESGCIPEIIIEEDSLLSVNECDKFRTRMDGQELPPVPAEVASQFSIRLVRVANHNNEDCLRYIHELAPDAILLGGTRILKDLLLEYLILNVHPGLLPFMRGSSPEAWSIYLDIPVGVTCHRVDAGIDTGPILLQRLLNMTSPLSYMEIVRQNVSCAATTMVDAVRLVSSGQGCFRPQEGGSWKTHPVMPSELLEKVHRKLVEGKYVPKLPLNIGKES